MALAGAAFSLRRQRTQESEAAANDVQDFGPAVERLQPWSKLALAHGVYLVLVGGWPLLRRRSFLDVDGRKREGWLGKALGACLANVGIQLIESALHGGRVRREVRSLAVRTAMTFAALDFHHARISPVYLANGAAQLMFAILWGAEHMAEARELRRPPVAAHA
ncbi:MAG TPA: hypothetical protein VG454_06035 [Gemmatimonadales bacterium]|nr:hypothetical protein [Gemmatimonadales bacterium]